MRWLKFSFGLVIGLLLILFLTQFVLPLFKNNNSLLQVETPGVVSNVFLNEKMVGETPYLGERLREGEYNLRLEADIESPQTKRVQFTKKITLSSQVLASVNYDFGPHQKFSAGDIRTFRIGDGLSVIGEPQEAKVWLDGQEMGKAPISLSPNSGVHKLKISAPGYYSREMEINIQPGRRLIVEVLLAANPFDRLEKIQDGNVVLYDLSSSRNILTTDSPAWAEATFFYEKTKKLSFDSLLDVSGNQYFRDKDTWNKKIKQGKKVVVGYLGNAGDGGLTESAKETLALFSKVEKKQEEASTKKVQILSTPTGTLNVRKGPGLSYNIIAKVNPGEKYNLLEEKSGWFKIKLTSTVGWVSSQYAKKL